MLRFVDRLLLLDEMKGNSERDDVGDLEEMWQINHLSLIIFYGIHILGPTFAS